MGADAVATRARDGWYSVCAAARLPFEIFLSDFSDDNDEESKKLVDRLRLINYQSCVPAERVWLSLEMNSEREHLAGI